MKIKDLTKDDLENMNYDDIAYLILNEEQKQLKINELFKKVCEILNKDNTFFENEIANFFELMSTDKRFIMLDNGLWDLKQKHNPKMILVDEDDDDSDEELEEENVEVKDEPEEEIFYDEDEDEDDNDDDLEELVVVDEEQTDSL